MTETYSLEELNEQFGVGQPIRRLEDARFLTGAGRYLDDIVLPKMTHVVIVRSPHAHATFTQVDAAETLAMAGVVAVLTGADWESDRLGGIPTRTPARRLDGSAPFVPPRPGLCVGRVRFVGDAVAMVIAETRAQAVDAAEALVIDYQAQPACISAEQALQPGAKAIWPEHGGNTFIEFEAGNGDAVDAAFAEAAHVVEVHVDNQRVTAVPMEPRGAIGQYDAATGAYELTCSTQNVHANRGDLAKSVFDVAPERIMQWAPDVGGGFGGKNSLYPEHALVLWAARRVGRPVKWASERGEAFMSDCHGRDQQSTVRLALDTDGRFLALDVTSIGAIGAYLLSTGGFTCTGGTARTQGGPYRLPAMRFTSRAVFTHSSPVEPYRGAGRPEASLQMEQVVDAAARRLGMDPAELRRRNVLGRGELPYKTAMGAQIDCGNFAGVLEQALTAIDADGHAARASAAKADGRLLGLGIGLYFECTGGAPKEYAEIEVMADGGARLAVGSHSTGTGHQTVFTQMLGARFGVDPARVDFVQADTRATPLGGGHGGSRSLEMAGAALVGAADRLVAQLRPLAAEQLEAAEADLAFDRGVFRIKGTDRALDVPALLNAAGLSSAQDNETATREGTTFPNGCHIAEVSVELHTGVCAVERFVVVDDFGTIVNPLTTAGQVMGGVVQGIGQALMERVHYDGATGQLTTGSLMDYALPRASDVCDLNVAFDESAPTALNVLGAKGCGEAGCCGALPAVVNAVANALAPAGVTAVPMPLTASNVWGALERARA